MDKLSNEEVLLIIHYISPYDIGAFSSVNRMIHALCSARLAHHKALKDRCTKVILSKETSKKHALKYLANLHQTSTKNALKHPANLLYQIWKDPFIAYYVRRVNFACKDVYLPPSYVETDTSRIDLDTRKIVQQLEWVNPQYLLNLPVDPRVMRSSMENLSCGSETDSFEILLACLPSLRTLHIHETYRHKTQLLDSLGSYTLLNGGLGPYPKLETVELCNDSLKAEIDIDTLASFALLPSVRIIRGSGIRVPGNWNIGSSTWESAVSRVECIELDESELDDIALSRLLLPMRNLRVFRYAHEYFSNGIVHFDRWIEVLAGSVGDTLEVLFLSSLSVWNGGGSLVKSFKGLKRLRRLEIEAKTLTPHLDDDKEVQDLSPRLVDLMPSSIESIKLLGDLKGLNMLGLVRDISSEKDKLLPNLSLVMFGAGRYRDQAFEHELRNVGVTVIGADSTSEGYMESIMSLGVPRAWSEEWRGLP